jgi:hypothetical protein
LHPRRGKSHYFSRRQYDIFYLIEIILFNSVAEKCQNSINLARMKNILIQYCILIQAVCSDGYSFCFTVDLIVMNAVLCDFDGT